MPLPTAADVYSDHIRYQQSTAERAEIAEKEDLNNLCELCVLCGEIFF